jgi:hypothetical protein
MLTHLEHIAMASKVMQDAKSRKGIKPTLRNRIVVAKEIQRLDKLWPNMAYSELEDLVKFFTPWYK